MKRCELGTKSQNKKQNKKIIDKWIISTCHYFLFIL